MMKWKKYGQIFYSKKLNSWNQHSALTPTPILLDAETIRVYAGFRDKQGVSRIGYVDLAAYDLTTIKKIASQPALDIGKDGHFDDNGVILGDVVWVNNRLRMYYIGFQLVKKVKFLAFTGVAESDAEGEEFKRITESPILDRAPHANMIRAIHSAVYEDNKWKIWYAGGNDWQLINHLPYPKYTIWYTESSDGLSFHQSSTLCVNVVGNEYRIGRPSVYKREDRYYMFYTKGSTTGKDYLPGLAISSDGLIWERQDAKLGLTLSGQGFDSLHLCYPRLIAVNGRTYCIYNGNNMGVDGFGLAELLAW